MSLQYVDSHRRTELLKTLILKRAGKITDVDKVANLRDTGMDIFKKVKKITSPWGDKNCNGRAIWNGTPTESQYIREIESACNKYRTEKFKNNFFIEGGGHCYGVFAMDIK